VYLGAVHDDDVTVAHHDPEHGLAHSLTRSHSLIRVLLVRLGLHREDGRGADGKRGNRVAEVLLAVVVVLVTMSAV